MATSIKKFIFAVLFLYSIPCFAQSLSELNISISKLQADLNNNQSAYNNAINIANNAQAQITSDTAQIATLQAEVIQYNYVNAQTASGVNWDYFVTLEPQIPFATWSKVNNGINWPSIIPTLGINCGGIVEANVNWTNWGTCEANGMTAGSPFGGYNTGIAAFWCGNGKITGTC